MMIRDNLEKNITVQPGTHKYNSYFYDDYCCYDSIISDTKQDFKNQYKIGLFLPEIHNLDWQT